MYKVVFPKSAAIGILHDMVGLTSPGALVLRLFVNDATPSGATAPGSLVEASGRGYAAITLDPDLWYSVAGRGVAAFYPEQTWTFTAGAAMTVYGYYVTNAAGSLRWARRFEQPVVVPLTESTLPVSLVLELS